MKKSTAYALLYFATILAVAVLSSCQTRSVVRPNPCPTFSTPHNRDMPYTHAR
jgi:hypothetical protein